MNQTILDIIDLNYQANQKKILDNVSLQIKHGDFITIMGPNGAGKSVLLKIIAGILAPTSGQINREKQLQIGYMPQKLPIDKSMPMKVKDFLSYLRKNTPQEFAEICEKLHLSAILDQYAYNLSGGELQRVILARCLLKNPDILLLDEPTQNLDYKSQLEFYDFIEKIYQTQKMAIIMVSHDLHFVMSSSTQIICLYHHICCRGDANSISQAPEFQKIFGDHSAKIGFFQHHQHDHHHDHSHD